MWTGRQALSVGLVDGIGGLSRAIDVAQELANINSNSSTKSPLRLQVLQGRREGLASILRGGVSAKNSAPLSSQGMVQALCDSTVFDAGLLSPESVGMGSLALRQLGLPPSMRFELSSQFNDDLTRFMDTSLVDIVTAFLSNL